jgi:hypothetical protein
MFRALEGQKRANFETDTQFMSPDQEKAMDDRIESMIEEGLEDQDIISELSG